MRCLILLAAFLAVVSATNVKFHNCGGASDKFQTVSLDASSWPPKGGVEEVVTVKGNLLAPLDNGTYTAQIKFDGVTVETLKGNLAELGLVLPAQPGPQTLVKKIKLPKFIPAGSVEVEITAHDSNGSELMCVDASTSHFLTSDVPIPFTTCDDTFLHIDSLTASQWPPVPGQSLTISGQGTLKEDVTEGKYHVDLTFDNVPLKSLDGSLSDLGLQMPLKAGPIQLTKTITIPNLGLSGTIGLTVKVTDQNGNTMGCVQITTEIKAPTSRAVELADEELTVDVPYSMCGDETYIHIDSFKANVWPPKQGSSVTILGVGTLKEDLTKATYKAHVTFDGIKFPTPLSGSLTDFGVPLPLKAGPISLTRTIHIPNLHLSGHVVSSIRVNDQDDKEIACIKIEAHISRNNIMVDARVAEFEDLLDGVLKGEIDTSLNGVFGHQ